MADLPISGLPEAGPLTGVEVLPVVQDGVTTQVATQQIALLAAGNALVGVTSTLGVMTSVSPNETVNVNGVNGGFGTDGFQAGRVLRIHSVLAVDGNGGDGCIKLYLRDSVDTYIDLLTDAGEVFADFSTARVVTVDAHVFYGSGGAANESTVDLHVTVAAGGAYASPQRYVVAVPTPALSSPNGSFTFTLAVKFENTGSTVEALATSLNILAFHGDVPYTPIT